jgi:hypothetical protein
MKYRIVINQNFFLPCIFLFNMKYNVLDYYIEIDSEFPSTLCYMLSLATNAYTVLEHVKGGLSSINFKYSI